MDSFEVIKATGEREKFSLSKLKRSMSNAGAQPPEIKIVINALEEGGYFRDGITTKELYREAYRLLKKNSKPVASRYKLKEALVALGPSGYPFEVLVSEIFKRLGYKTEIGKIISGKCISHEIDVIAQDKNEILMIECKFHNRKHHHCNVTIPLYVHSRFKDVADTWNSDPTLKSKNSLGYIATNTRFTQDAIDYAECMNLKLLSWDHPKDQGLRVLVKKTHIYPVTVLSSLTKKEKELLFTHKVVHCQQLLDNKEVLKQLQFNHAKISSVLKESQDLCFN